VPEARFEDGSQHAPTSGRDEGRFRFLADSIPQQVWTAKPDGALDYVNARVVDYFQRSYDEIIGAGWLDLLHPEDVAGCVARWTGSLTSGEPYEFEFRLWSAADRRYRWHVARALARRDDGGRITQWFGTNTDIDERRRSEDAQRFLLDAGRRLSISLDYQRTLAELAAICVPELADWCVIDAIGTSRQIERVVVAHADPEAGELADRIRGFPSGSQANHPGSSILQTGKSVLVETLGEADLERFAVNAEHKEALRELAIGSYLAVPLVATDQVIGVLTLVTTRTSGRRFGARDLALAEDVGRRAALALQNARHHRDARVANEELDHFAHVASHDLKAPLRGIASLSSWLEEGLEGKLDDESREHMRLLRSRVHRLEALIDGILAYARAGRSRGREERIEVGALLAEVIELLAPPREMQVEIGEMPTLTAERAPFQQVFMNLISNALTHAKSQGGRVDVACRDLGAAFEFQVRDDGPGIAAEFHDRIWTLFQTLEARGNVESTGIGLSVVKKIVEARGGHVRVASTLGEGATFFVLWPKSPEDLA
jgi:PAS domain S-box-containing protein